jgi:hypothetical protein
VSDLLSRERPTVHFVNDLGVGLRLVGNDRHRLIQACIVTCLLEKSARRLGISPRRKAEIDQLTARINRPP